MSQQKQAVAVFISSDLHLIGTHPFFLLNLLYNPDATKMVFEYLFSDKKNV